MRFYGLRVLILLILISTGCGSGTSGIAAPTLPAPQAFTWSGTDRPLLLSHYMPWFRTKKFSGDWGWHWTMDFTIPQQAADGSWTKLAARYTPLTGPYDSSDPALLEYQINLMKLSGIDGVIVDWYGMDSYLDYGPIHASTQKLIQAIQQASLKFAICYEDQTVRSMVAQAHIQGSSAAAYGHTLLQYLQDTWFKDPGYLKTADGRPVLLIFGPQYYSAPSDWQTIFQGIQPRPILAALDEQGDSFAEASFPWPPMGSAQAGTLSQADLNSYLDRFYTRVRASKYRIAGAFPGFDDFYKDANISPSRRYLDERAGATLHDTLQKAMDTHPDVIQLITWNDYGESTQIEPSVQQQYRYLEIVQQARRDMDSQFRLAPQDLRLPLQIYKLRETQAENALLKAQLDQASAAIRHGDPRAAAQIVESIR